MKRFGLIIEIVAAAIGIFSLHAMGIGVGVLLVVCGIAAVLALVLVARRTPSR